MMRPLQGCPRLPFEGYNRTSPQRSPWRQKKVAVVETWSLWGDKGCSMTIFFREYKMFFLLLSSCLLCSIIMVIQSYIMYRDKIHKRLKNQFKNLGTARQIFGTVPRLPVPRLPPGGRLPPSGRLPPPGDYLREVVSAPLKF